MGEWFYIGHYGQLGPLTREQIDELIAGGVIASETYIWKQGMVDWIPADQVPELMQALRTNEALTPPPMPTAFPMAKSAPPVAPQLPESSYSRTYFGPEYHGLGAVRSDKSRILGAVLQFVIPGVGRIYLGYAAIGILQFVLALCGVGYVWSVIDGILMLTGSVRMDGYGRRLSD